MDLATTLESFVKEATQDWGIKHHIEPKFDFKKTEDPFNTAYVLDMKYIHYYISNILKRSKETHRCKFDYNEELRFVTYHEAGHIRQMELGLSIKEFRELKIDENPVDRFLYFAYTEFTDEYSTIKLLYEKKKSAVATAHFSYLRYAAKNLPEELWWGALQENYPYMHAYRQLGREGYKECEEIYEDLRRRAIRILGKPLPDLLEKLEGLFDNISLRKKDTYYYVKWDKQLNQKLRSIGHELNSVVEAQ